VSRLILFGTGGFAEVARAMFELDSPHDVVAFTVDEPLQDTFAGLPLVPFAELAQRFPPDEHAMFVAVGYRRVNRLRAELCARARAAGYELVSYLSSKASHWGDTAIGANTFVFEDNTLQPFVTLGEGVVLWSGNHIGHHATIGDYCFVTSHVVIAGFTRVGAYSFLGVNATLRDDIEIGESNVIGAGALIMRSTQDHEVYVPERTRPHAKRSDEIGL
jgi:sugar O-acyltransferase (sialic acid O-acetyltransferase NeuD family)